MSRLLMICDALSQLANVALFPMSRNTSANESISGRAHRCGWLRTEAIINRLFSLWEQDHCRKAYEADRLRAEKTLREQPVTRNP